MANDASHDLKKTPLYDAHLAAGARMVAFGGWLMPVQYAGITEEHVAVRASAGLFDVSHMGQVEVRGAPAAAFLDHLLPNHVRALRPGGILYTPMCNEAGGIMDDLLVYRRGEADYLLVVNASRKDADLAWIEAQAGEFTGVSVSDASDRYAMVALQGPHAEAILGRHADADLSALEYYHFLTARIAGIEALVSRTGYTGEDGFEVLCPWAEGPKVWDLLLQEAGGNRAAPAGLGARDTLRLEAGYALYGSDLSEETTPLEARLRWTVRFDKPGDFVGRAALLRQQEAGVSRRLVGLRMTERAIPRSHQRILSRGDDAVGEITSGTFSPTLKAGIALGYVRRGFSRPGAPLFVEIRTDRKGAEVVKLPFVASHVKQKH
jgi:aminomethyltransferase